jgi:hypothetical protein
MTSGPAVQSSTLALSIEHSQLTSAHPASTSSPRSHSLSIPKAFYIQVSITTDEEDSRDLELTEGDIDVK